MKEILSDEDRNQIREAVFSAEKRTSGEIVPYITRRSARYEIALWRGATIAGAIAFCVLVLLSRFYQGWSLSWLYSGTSQATVIVGAALLGVVLAAYVPALRRILAGNSLLAEQVHRRALQAFVEKEVFNTRDRTGILLFVSLFEHRIEVVGDAGINQKVTQEAWSNVVLSIRDGIKTGKLAAGLVAGIDQCGALLEQCGVEIQPDDTNELSDDLTIADQ